MDTTTTKSVKTTTRVRTKRKTNPVTTPATAATATANTNATSSKVTTNGTKPQTSKPRAQHQAVKAQHQPPVVANSSEQHQAIKPEPIQSAMPARDQHQSVKMKVEEPQPNNLDVQSPESNSKAKEKAKKAPRAVKSESQNVHFKLVMEAAKTVVGILKDHDIPCAVFGSLAAKLYGSSRCPKDVDILISQPVVPPSESPIVPTRPHTPGGSPAAEALASSSTPSTEAAQPLNPVEIKNLILSNNSRNFYLKMPRDPTAEYRILWYRESYMGPECKVDILIPGIMYLPFITPQQTRWIDEIPVVPFSLLLLHKLQGWDDHRKAEEGYQQKKQQQDAGDVRKLMGLKREMGEVRKERPWADLGLFCEEFQELTRERVRDYCLEFPDRIEGWKFLGFDVPDVVVAKVVKAGKVEEVETEKMENEKVEPEVEELKTKSA